MDQEAFHYLALSLTAGLGRRKIRALMEVFGSAGRVLAASRKSLREAGLRSGDVASIVSRRGLEEAEREARRAARSGVRILSPASPSFPPLLREIDDLPMTLYCLGDVAALRSPSVAVVGSRKCSVYGGEVSRRFSRELCRCGLTIVSGLARGIDSQAHRGALEAEGRTVGVLGCGVDVVYPRENAALFSQVRQAGCLVSEFPLGSFPAPRNFPLRNRLISGLCYGTVISEATECSGSLITARLSMEQNREVWAIPGNITSPGSYGPNDLIRQGARPVVCPQDVLEELSPQVLATLKRSLEKDRACRENDPEAGTRGVPLNGLEKKILKLIPPDQTLHIDCMVEQIGARPERLVTALLDLEMKGLVRQLPGKRFSQILF